MPRPKGFQEDSNGYWIVKDPGATKPYTIDWYPFLRGNDKYWAPRTSFYLNQTITPSAKSLNNHRYRCTTPGTSSDIEPTWTTGSGSTVLDGTIVWTEIGVEDTISTAAYTVQTGMTKVAESTTSTTSTVKISGGTANTVYTVDCLMTSTGGVIESSKFRVSVKDV